LDNPIQDYAGGSKTAIAAFLGRDNPSGRPEAELWIGAHPKAPSRVRAGPSLAELIRGAPRAMLGAGLEKQYGAELPFLLKMIAAAEPLSIPCHPNAQQPRAAGAGTAGGRPAARLRGCAAPWRRRQHPTTPPAPSRSSWWPSPDSPPSRASGRSTRCSASSPRSASPPSPPPWTRSPGPATT